MRKRQSAKVALCGVMCGLAVVVMLSGSIIPCATFCAPAISGFFLLPVAMECGMHLAWVCYAAISLMSILLVPDKEMAAIFVFFLGYYPLLKAYLQRIHNRILRIVIKILVFNGSILAMYTLLLYLFPIQYLVEEFAQTAGWMLMLLLIMANICFWIYDAALVNVLHLYILKLKPRLRNLF